MPYTTLPDPVLALSLTNVNKLNNLDLDQLAGLWNVFTKCGESLESGRRLENLSWRLWFREAHLLPLDASSDFELSNSTDCTSTPLEGSTPIGTPRTSRSASLNLVAAGINAAFAPNPRHSNNHHPSILTNHAQSRSQIQSQDLSDPESGNWSSEESVGDDDDEEEEEGQAQSGKGQEHQRKSSSATGKPSPSNQRNKLERGSSERSRGRSTSAKKRPASSSHHQQTLQEGSNSDASTSQLHSRTSSSSSSKNRESESERPSTRPRYPKHASFDVGERDNNSSPTEESSIPNNNSLPSTSQELKSQSGNRSSRPLSSASAFGSRARVRQRNQSLSAGGGGSAAAARRRRPLSFGEAVESLALGLDGVGSKIGGGNSSSSVNTYQGSNGKGKEKARSSLGLGYTLNTSASHPALGKTDGMTTTYESDAEEHLEETFISQSQQQSHSHQDEKERIERERMPPPPLPPSTKSSTSTSKYIPTPASTATNSQDQVDDTPTLNEKGKSRSKFFVGSCTSHASVDSAEFTASPAPSPSLPQEEDISKQSSQEASPQVEETQTSKVSNDSTSNPSSAAINRPSSRRTPSDASSATSEKSHNNNLPKKSHNNQSQSNLAHRRSKSGTSLHKSGHTASAHGRKSSGTGLAGGARNPSFLRGMTGLTAMTKVEKPIEKEKRNVESSSKSKGTEKEVVNDEKSSTADTNQDQPKKEMKLEIPSLKVAAPTPAPSPPPSATQQSTPAITGPSQHDSSTSLSTSAAAILKDNSKVTPKKPVKFTMGCDDESEDEWSEDEEVKPEQKAVNKSQESREEKERPEPSKAGAASSSKGKEAQSKVEDEEEEEVEDGDDSDWSSDEPTAEELQAEKEAAAAQRKAEEEQRQREMFQKRPIRSASATDVRKFGNGLTMSGINPTKSSAAIKHPNPNPSPPIQPVRGFLSSLFHPEQADHPPPGQLAGRPHASAADLRTGISTVPPSQQVAAATGNGNGLSKLEEIDENDPHHKQRQRNRMIREAHHQRERNNRKDNRDASQPGTSFTSSRAIGGGGLKTSKSAVALPVLNTVASSTSIHGMDQITGQSMENQDSTLSKSHSRSRSKDREDDKRDGRSTFSRRASGDSHPKHQRSSSSGNVNLEENEEDEDESDDEVPQPSSLALARLSQLAKKKNSSSSSNNDLKNLLPIGGSTGTAKARKRNSVSTNGSGSNVSFDSTQQQPQQPPPVRPQLQDTFRYTNESMFKKKPGEVVGNRNEPTSSSTSTTQAVPSHRTMSNQDVTTLAQPQTPRTTRRNMLRDELSESLRQNLLWERQSRNRMLGIGAIGNNNNNQGSSSNLAQQQQLAEQQQLEQQRLLLQQQQQQQQNQLNRSNSQSVLSGNLRPLTSSTTSKNNQHSRDGSSSSNLKRNQSTEGGFHHSGW